MQRRFFARQRAFDQVARNGQVEHPIVTGIDLGDVGGDHRQSVDPLHQPVHVDLQRFARAGLPARVAALAVPALAALFAVTCGLARRVLVGRLGGSLVGPGRKR